MKNFALTLGLIVTLLSASISSAQTKTINENTTTHTQVPGIDPPIIITPKP